MDSMKTTYFFMLILGFTACKGDKQNDETSNFSADTLMSVDTAHIQDSVEAVFVDSSGYVDEELEIATIIEEKYGEQWDFCDCIVKNDSVNKAFLNVNEDDDEQFDEIFARSEVIDQHCKEILATPNTTPEERARHDRKVQKCLKSAKKNS
jgi:hypothetical protein